MSCETAQMRSADIPDFCEDICALGLCAYTIKGHVNDRLEENLSKFSDGLYIRLYFIHEINFYDSSQETKS